MVKPCALSVPMVLPICWMMTGARPSVGSSNRTEPWRWPTMPMMDFSVVVLPAPLRPSSVTTSPGSTANVAPCRMWDSPYQACNASTASSGAAVLASSMADPHVGLADLRVGRDRLVIAFGEDAAAGQHGDAVGQIGDDAEIVLDHQHRAIGRDRSDQCGDALDILMPHAGGRLVEQQHLRVERQGGGDLQRPLAAIGQFHRLPAGERGEPD